MVTPRIWLCLSMERKVKKRMKMDETAEFFRKPEQEPAAGPAVSACSLIIINVAENIMKVREVFCHAVSPAANGLKLSSLY